jgi:hypothetical protein
LTLGSSDDAALAFIRVVNTHNVLIDIVEADHRPLRR